MMFGARARAGGGLSVRAWLASLSVSPSLLGVSSPLPAAFGCLATAPASRSVWISPTRSEPQWGFWPASARRRRCPLFRGWSPCSLGCCPPHLSAVLCQPPAPAPRSLGISPPRPEPCRGYRAESTRRRRCLSFRGSPSRPKAPLLPCHRAPDPGLICWGVGFHSPPPRPCPSSPPQDQDAGGAPGDP